MEAIRIIRTCAKHVAERPEVTCNYIIISSFCDIFWMLALTFKMCKKSNFNWNELKLSKQHKIISNN